MTQPSLPTGTQRSRLSSTIEAFLNKKVAYGGTLQSDSRRLYSYLVVIGEWIEGGIRLPDSKVFHSRTTTRHRNMLEDMATSKGIKVMKA